ncbi:MAG TPA: bifunctional 23S rRNA (guanine(2069)-N(7))-methyltransferase RlmK/23S rRNA (guanine(2445)-N(2))-methyltransferase RlmL [Steroidobacteraceae bacterium]|nr:bifunctional 23S rRNA (guanine(2069)-N(7))-methyltransferase RlmK/23S rRNA (guanine(2445)-N(2))-methyltransferase RlmL [Steroidobacteraceae bacterium]
MTPGQFLASVPRGLADLLARELAAFGATDVKERTTGVAFSGTLETAYRACLESRLANRVFLEIARFEAPSAEAFYAAAREVDWSQHIGPRATLACDFSGKHPSITHSHFGALKLKDAIVDAVRDATGARPDIMLDRPGVRVHAHARDARITLSIDLSGESLHRRGYRGAAGEAPLKENVAAGMLVRAGWPELAAAGAQFLDPLCGSGTLVIEAALIAAYCAPALRREYFGFLGWRGHDAALWRRVREEAQARSLAGAQPTVILHGSDRDPLAVRDARANAQRAGIGSWVQFEVRPLANAAPARTESHGAEARGGETRGGEARGGEARGGEAHGGEAHGDEAHGGEAGRDQMRAASGLLCTNPPYGVRMADLEAARAVHCELGEVLRERFQGWHAAVLTGAPQLGMELGIRAARTHALWNGAIECRLLRMTVEAASLRRPGTLGRGESTLRDTPGARMFANRLEKNLKRLRSWANRAGVTCYRLYDADMPEYAFAIDVYQTIGPEETWLYAQEYAPPAEIEEEAVRRRRGEALSALPGVAGVSPEHIKLRTRRRTPRGEQYGKVAEQGKFHTVLEGGLRFLVNFDDYLDTGLFLDHRITRARLREAAAGRRFLNLFAYTGTASVYAAAGGAVTTTSVDLSRTYLDWAQRNLALNGVGPEAHELIQADCLEWLRDDARGRECYDLIFLDPPTFSNSKRMQGVLDIERDHPALIEACMGLLAPGGLMVFSTNAQRFKLDPALAARYAIRDISAATLPRDFERNPRIHRCFEVRHPD